MEPLGIRLVGFNAGAQAGLAYSAAIAAAAVLQRALVRKTVRLPSDRATRRTGWARRAVSLVVGLLALVLPFAVWSDIQTGDARGDVLDVGPFRSGGEGPPRAEPSAPWEAR